MLATPELKAKVGYRTELTTNSFSRRCQQSSTRKTTNICDRFPSTRLLATPKDNPPLSPASLFPTGTFTLISRSITLRTSRRWRPFLTVYRVTSLAESDTFQFCDVLDPAKGLRLAFIKPGQMALLEVSKVPEVNFMSESSVTGPFDSCRLLY